jgi:hypothetical protein
MLFSILHFGRLAQDAAMHGVRAESIVSMAVRSRLARMKEVEEKAIEQEAAKINKEISAEFDQLIKSEAETE